VSATENIGYVYILEVSDIDLPVCKIGRTSKSPTARCAEINRSSTGDFLWQVAYEFPVNDCKRFEKLIHTKLDPLSQKNREFFNITAVIASNAVQSILDAQSEIEMVEPTDIGERPAEVSRLKEEKKLRSIHFRQKDSEYADILALFTKITGCKGRPFGQLNKPYFGMSDGNEGVQWNIAIYTEPESIRLGVHLEGLTYTNWPIATLILNELAGPRFFNARDKLTDSDQVFLRLTRDAWQAACRPNIVEKFIGPGDISTKNIDAELWQSMLAEAKECLSEEKGYRGRASQSVTFANKPSQGDKSRRMGVSPHLTIWTPVESSGDMETHLKVGIDRLTPIHDWVSRASQSAQ
jgi:hypothetical protein